MQIPLSKPKVNYDKLGFELEKVFKSNWWTTGSITQQLEKEFAEYKKVKHAVAVSSCSAALHIAVRILYDKHITHGIITTPLTFCSTINSIIHNGGTPLLIDVDKQSKCIDLSNEDFKYMQGVILVHFAGYPCNMDWIEKARKNNVWVIEDCAHSVEGLWKGQPTGTIGDIGCFSFSPTKNLAAPEMGMLITNNDEIAEKARVLRLHGLSTDTFDRINKPGQYDIIDLGYKYNCTDIEATVALNQLRCLEDNWLRREEIWKEYQTFFHSFKTRGIFNGEYPTNEGVWFDREPRFADESYLHGLHLFQITLNNRNDFINEMKARGIFCGIHYNTINSFSYYQNKYNFKMGIFPNAENFAKYCVSLPLGPGMTKDEVNYVISCIRELLETERYLFE